MNNSKKKNWSDCDKMNYKNVVNLKKNGLISSVTQTVNFHFTCSEFSLERLILSQKFGFLNGVFQFDKILRKSRRKSLFYQNDLNKEKERIPLNWLNDKRLQLILSHFLFLLKSKR